MIPVLVRYENGDKDLFWVSSWKQVLEIHESIKENFLVRYTLSCNSRENVFKWT